MNNLHMIAHWQSKYLKMSFTAWDTTFFTNIRTADVSLIEISYGHLDPNISFLCENLKKNKNW